MANNCQEENLNIRQILYSELMDLIDEICKAAVVDGRGCNVEEINSVIQERDLSQHVVVVPKENVNRTTLNLKLYGHLDNVVFQRLKIEMDDIDRSMIENIRVESWGSFYISPGGILKIVYFSPKLFTKYRFLGLGHLDSRITNFDVLILTIVVLCALCLDLKLEVMLYFKTMYLIKLE